MNNKEVTQIIENYEPLKGFFDLTQRPKNLTKKEYAKILKMQEYLAEQETNKEYLKKFEPMQWQKMKELSADYQAIVLEHWKQIPE